VRIDRSDGTVHMRSANAIRPGIEYIGRGQRPQRVGAQCEEPIAQSRRSGSLICHFPSLGVDIIREHGSPS
jgi:hypothetical protein